MPEENGNGKNGNRKQSPDAVNPGGQKGIQINRLMGNRIPDQEESGIGSSGIEYAVKNRGDHKCDQPFRQPDYGKTHNPCRQPYLVWQDVTQQTAEFFPFLQRNC